LLINLAQPADASSFYHKGFLLLYFQLGNFLSIIISNYNSFLFLETFKDIHFSKETKQVYDIKKGENS